MSSFQNYKDQYVYYGKVGGYIVTANEDVGYSAYGNSRKEWDDGNRWNFENPGYR